MTAVRTINVVEATALKTGTNPQGGTWTLYEIVALTPEGDPIDLKLKSFDKLEGTVEVEVDKQVHEKYGTSFMLKPVRKGGGSPGARLGPKFDELRGRVERLEGIVEVLQGDVKGLRSLVTQLTHDDPPAPPAPTTRQPAQNAIFGDEGDVPF